MRVEIAVIDIATRAIGHVLHKRNDLRSNGRHEEFFERVRAIVQVKPTEQEHVQQYREALLAALRLRSREGILYQSLKLRRILAAAVRESRIPVL